MNDAGNDPANDADRPRDGQPSRADGDVASDADGRERPPERDEDLGGEAPAEAVRQDRRRFSPIWLVPLVAACVAGFLAYRTLIQRGPSITITFGTADGLTAGQTPVRYKALQVGTVERLTLNKGDRRIVAHVRLNRDADGEVTDRSRFWVVRPRVTTGSISGLETIVSGSYVELDPGEPGGGKRREFEGLDSAPAVRSDEQGRLFKLRARRLGSLTQDSPVFFHDVQAGRVTGFDTPGLDGVVALQVFIQKPYDEYVREDSRFWNASGLRANLGPEGLKLELESVRALVSGGIAFDTPASARNAAPAAQDAEFALYEDLDAARAATTRDRVLFVIYFDGSVRGLGAGTPVEMRGVRIGSVTDVKLEYNSETRAFRTPVRLAVEPDRFFEPAGHPRGDMVEFIRGLVADGLRAQIASASLLTGQKLVTLDFVPNPPPAEVGTEGDVIVLPALGGTGDLMAAVSAISSKIERLPLDEIARHLDDALASVGRLVGGPEVKEAVTSLSAAVKDAQELIRNADRGLDPLLRRLPVISRNLEQAIGRANSAVGSVEAGYGRSSDFYRDLDRLLAQANETARSVRTLADLLNRHPEALIRGRP